MYKRVPADHIPESRICHSIGEDDFRVVRGIALGTAISVPMWVGIVWVFSKCLVILQDWFR